MSSDGVSWQCPGTGDATVSKDRPSARKQSMCSSSGGHKLANKSHIRGKQRMALEGRQSSGGGVDVAPRHHGTRKFTCLVKSWSFQAQGVTKPNPKVENLHRVEGQEDRGRTLGWGVEPATAGRRGGR